MKVVEGKVVVLGAQGVGKTSLVVRYMGRKFSKHVSPTIGASFFTCNITLSDVRVKLQVWDTAGQERFRSMAPMYYRNANAALLVFDISSLQSYVAAKGWARELQSNVSEPLVLTLVGNKSDLQEQRQVTESEANVYAESVGAHYHETSALHDQGIDQVFLSTASSVLRVSRTATNTSLRTYDSFDGEDDFLPSGLATDDRATHTGREESPSWSIHSIAHGEIYKPYYCC